MRTRLYYGIFISILTLSSLMLVSTPVPNVQAAVTTDWNHVATVAWKYFQLSPAGAVDPNTGLEYGTLDWHYVTDWDIGNYLLAILDAQALGLIQQTGPWGATYRLNKVLSYLQTRTLRSDNGLPYWAYHSTDSSPGTDQSRLVTDVADTGRLLVALYVVETKRPDLAPSVNNILTRPTPTGATLHDVYNTNFIVGKTYNDLYGYYFTLGFAQFPTFFNVQSSTNAWNNLKSGPKVNVYSQLLPFTNIDSEIFLNGLLEIPNLVDSTFADYAYRTLLAQQGRYQATGKLTGWTEGASDVTPFYLYEWIVHTTTQPPLDAPGYTLWQLDDTIGGPSQSVINAGKVPIVYTKVAIGMNALFGTPYTQTLVNAVLGKVETQYGFREAIRESDGSVIGTSTWPIQDKTQSFALAAARYALSDPLGSLYRHRDAACTSPSVLEYDKYRHN